MIYYTIVHILLTLILQNINVMVHIPEEVGGAVPSKRIFKLLVILFRNDQLFQAIRAEANVADKFYVPSSVISASISKPLCS